MNGWLLRYVASLPRAWFSMIGGVVGAITVHSDDRVEWGFIMPAAIAATMTIRIALRSASLDEFPIFHLLAHRLSAAYLAFGVALVALNVWPH